MVLESKLPFQELVYLSECSLLFFFFLGFVFRCVFLVVWAWIGFTSEE